MSLDRAAGSLPATVTHLTPRCFPRTAFGVFVVEGQTAERSVLGQLIRANPSLHAVGEARTTDEALALLAAKTEQPDIVCLSWLLYGGGIDRWEFVDEVRRLCPDARLVMTCPNERDEVLRTAHEHGIDVLHSTRDPFHSLRRALHHAAQGQPYLSPRLQDAADRGAASDPRLRELVSHVSDSTVPGLSASAAGVRSRAIFERLGVNAVAVGFGPG
jgi:DNA-binding NarL/FixJ family response regulator